MKTFSQFQQQTPTYRVTCEAITSHDCNIVFEFKVEAINEKVATQKAEQVISDLNLKSVTKKMIRA